MRETEWPTLGVLGGCYLLWLGVTAFHAELGHWLAVPLLMLILAQHSSLQHEALHGHPFHQGWLNELTVFPALGLWLPYRRFRDLHLKHHRVPTLTDPHDDPESFYLPLTRWRLVGPSLSALLTFNNTLCGRMLIGPALAVTSFLATELGCLGAASAASASPGRCTCSGWRRCSPGCGGPGSRPCPTPWLPTAPSRS